jgi:hypothetical protein
MDEKSKKTESSLKEKSEINFIVVPKVTLIENLVFVNIKKTINTYSFSKPNAISFAFFHPPTFINN